MTDLNKEYQPKSKTTDITLTPTVPETAELNTAIINSLMSDARAQESDGTGNDKRGVWHNSITGEEYGSRLWTLERRKLTPDTLNKAREYAEEALQWLIDDRIATSVEVTTERRGIDQMVMNVTIRRTNGETTSLQYDHLWENIRGQ